MTGQAALTKTRTIGIAALACLMLLALKATEARPAELSDRFDSAFQGLTGDPVLEFGAWLKFKSPRFIAQVCVREPWFRLGCPGSADWNPYVLQVQSKTIPQQASDGTPFDEVTHLLDGVWAGDDFRLWIDTLRGQANIDPSHPFKWEHFLIHEVTSEGSVIFTIGTEVFWAEPVEHAMSLTGSNLRGSHVLRYFAGGH